MVVCKYFQQGYCSFGQNCRFEHVYGSKYSYHAPQNYAPVQQQTTAVSDDQLISQVHSDVQAALQGSQWVLSCYAPFKEKPILPGIPDLSPEEARLFIYEAKASNNIEMAVAYMNNLFKETRAKYEQLLHPTTSITNVLRSLYKGEAVSSPFSNTQNSAFGGSNTAASSIFRSAAQNVPNPSAFGQSNNVFGSPSTDVKSIFAQANQNAFGSPPNVNSNVFGPSPDVAAKSVFAQANQNVFGSPQNNPSSIFASASQQFFSSPPDPFGAKQTTSPFQNTNANASIFQSAPNPAANVFATTNVPEQSQDSGVYSKVEDLSQEDIEAFKNDDFRLGFVPELPPPQALCV